MTAAEDQARAALDRIEIVLRVMNVADHPSAVEDVRALRALLAERQTVLTAVREALLSASDNVYDDSHVQRALQLIDNSQA